MLRWQKVFLFSLVFLALFLADRAGFFNYTFNLIHRWAVSPVTRTVSYWGEESFFLFKNVLGVRGLIRENLFLKNQRDFFRGEYFKLVETKEENEFLRQALDLKKEGGRRMILGTILSFDPFQAADSLIINKGQKDDVVVNDVVVLAGNILVGLVKDVNQKESRVLLVTSPQSRVTVVSEDDRVKGVVNGSASGALTLDLVLKEAQLNPGQILLTSGLDGVFRRGLLVGEVAKVTPDASAPFQKASLRPFFNLRDLKQVFIMVSE
ncbi:MAG: rod shape-determining protein MreC [Minisyncoccia bacterium]